MLSVSDDQGWAGLIAGKSSPLFGREAVYLIELFLTKRLRGRGLAKILESQFLFKLRHDFEIVTDYFLMEFSSLSDKTRSVIVSTFTSMVDVLNRGLLRELFCTDTNITPAAIEDFAWP